MACLEVASQSCYMSNACARAAQLAAEIRNELARVTIPLRPSEHEVLRVYHIVAWPISEYYDGH